MSNKLLSDENFDTFFRGIRESTEKFFSVAHPDSIEAHIVTLLHPFLGQSARVADVQRVDMSGDIKGQIKTMADHYCSMGLLPVAAAMIVEGNIAQVTVDGDGDIDEQLSRFEETLDKSNMLHVLVIDTLSFDGRNRLAVYDIEYDEDGGIEIAVSKDFAQLTESRSNNPIIGSLFAHSKDALTSVFGDVL